MNITQLLHSSAQKHMTLPSYRSLCIALVCSLISVPGTAQLTFSVEEDGAPSGKATDKTIGKTAVVNGYGEMLRAKSKAKSNNHNTPAARVAYQPLHDSGDTDHQAEIEMFVGESRVFPAPGVSRIAVGNGGILTAAALDSKEVILFANAVGMSSLFVWNEDGRYQRLKINIVRGDTTRFAREISAFLANMPNARTSIIGDKVIVEGDNLSDPDIAKIDELAKRYPQVVNFTNRVGWEQMVLMDVKVVEFPVNELRQLGLKWGANGGVAVGGIWNPVGRGDQGGLQVIIPNSAAAITSSTGGSTVPLPLGLNILSGINLGLSAQLNLLAQEGKASVLAEPQLSARNGAKATFLAGGEYPYAVSNLAGTTVQFKPYGVKLDITPRVDRNGVIRATIESEVSALDFSVTVGGGYPALTTRKTSTEFNVRNGETLVLAGMISRKTATSIDKVPLLGDLPVLGALFRSKRFQNDETELVVFVTPTIVTAQSAGLVERVERAGLALEKSLGRSPYLSAPLQPGLDPAKPDLVAPQADAVLKQP